MPTQCFLNLPKEKQMKIVGASVCELSKVPADKISINKIIQTAGISRGSFYQYFDDKFDLINYLLSDLKNEMHMSFRKNLEKYNGNFFEITKAVYDEIILLGENENNLGVIKNFFMSMKFTKSDRLNFMKLFDISEEFFYNILLSYINQNNFRDTSKDFINGAVNIIWLLMRQSLTDVFSDYENLEIYKKDFYIRLDIIRRGVIKE